MLYVSDLVVHLLKEHVYQDKHQFKDYTLFTFIFDYCENILQI